jgi:tripartite motif-containing protein 71
MKRVISIIAATAAITLTCGETPTEPKSGWVYGGEFYDYGPGGGEWPVGLIPLGVAVLPQRGIVYVAIEGAFKPAGNSVRYFTANGRPLGICDDPDGDTYYYDVAASPSKDWVYAADCGEFRILYYTAVGSLIGSWDANGPTAIAVSPSDGTVYVAEARDYRIRYYTPTGSYLGEWGTEGSGGGQFKVVWGIDVAPGTGYIYVADTGNDRIQYFTSSGSFLGKWGTTGSGAGELDAPTDVAISPADGNVYTVEPGNHRVQYFTPDGSFVGMFGFYGMEPGQFRAPCSLRFNATGYRLYVADSSNGVQYFDYYE